MQLAVQKPIEPAFSQHIKKNTWFKPEGVHVPDKTHLRTEKPYQNLHGFSHFKLPGHVRSGVKALIVSVNIICNQLCTFEFQFLLSSELARYTLISSYLIFFSYT